MENSKDMCFTCWESEEFCECAEGFDSCQERGIDPHDVNPDWGQ